MRMIFDFENGNNITATADNLSLVNTPEGVAIFFGGVLNLITFKGSMAIPMNTPKVEPKKEAKEEVKEKEDTPVTPTKTKTKKPN